MMNRLDVRGVRVTFLTLTFSGTPSVEDSNIAFKRFTMRLRRKFQTLSGVWRLERQERGSIHFHLMLFNFPFVPQRLIQNVWQECTGEQRSIVHVKLVDNIKMLIRYVAKYIAKVTPPVSSPSLEPAPYQHELTPQRTGRMWGYINKDSLPFAEITTIVTEDTDLGGYLWFAVRSMSRGKSGNYQYCAKVYTDEGDRMMKFALDHGAIPLEALTEHRFDYLKQSENSSVVPCTHGTSVLFAAS